MRKLARVAMICSAGLIGGTSGAQPAKSRCDRACLVAIGDGYLAALAAHDPAAAPLSDHARFVENVTPLQPGAGLWASAAGPATAFRIYVPDPTRGSIGLMTVIDRRTAAGITPAQLAVRLKVEAGEIVEAEHVVADVPQEAERARLEKPRANLTATVPVNERMSRDDLAGIAGSYYNALNGNDGSLAPFAEDCEREENFLITASAELAPAPFDGVDVNGRPPPPVARDCAGQMSSRRFAYIDSIDNRRIFAVDPVQGLAMGLSQFRQSMTHGAQLTMAADGSRLMWEERRDPYDLAAAHIFKITGDQIHEVEAVGVFLPYGSPTGWE